MTLFALVAALYLAFVNGANDNFKGFATVWGSASLGYRGALAMATLATIAGGLVSVLLANGLVQQFSGKGLVPDALVATPAFALAVAGGAAITVGLATRLGFPISTTHALIGGLLGAGFGSGATVAVGKLGSAFVLPLLSSPLIASLLAFAAYRAFCRLMPARTPHCACIVAATAAPGGVLARDGEATLVFGHAEDCARNPAVLASARMPAPRDLLHIATAMAICFARGLNDTPKLAALLIAGGAFATVGAGWVVAAAMAAGGLLLARRVAETMSRRITSLDPGQGIAANVVTAAMVLGASAAGLPVSTTHVSVGSIIGVGSSAHTAHWPVIREVLASWLLTLPIAAVSAAAIAAFSA